ncbi:MAG: M23 family metallopeptidase [Leptolyngbyaceae bacterium]|nr:M23 family metallopeptidase [Leptolyngbyaceae bacterium]
MGLGLTALAIVEVKTSAFGAQDIIGTQAIGTQDTVEGDRTADLMPEATVRPAPDIDAPVPAQEALIADAPQTDSFTTLTSAEIEANAVSRSQASQASEASEKAVAVESTANDSATSPSVADFSNQELALAAWAGASFPVENFQAYTSPFGYRQAPDGSYRREFHYGLDIAAPQGSYIRSWWSGTVLEITDNTNCGTSIVVQSGAWVHIYCHMQGRAGTSQGRRYLNDPSSGLQIWEGQSIRAGDRIGRVGMTGRTTGPHLHWGLKYNGNWVDPAWVIRAMAVSQRASAQ